MANRLSEEQIAELEKTFVDLDQDNDGAITKDELRCIMTAYGGDSPSEDELNDIIGKFGFQGTDKIGFNQFLSLMLIKMNATCEDELEELFNLLDLDGDGLITGTEIGLVMESIGQRLSDKEIEDMVEEADLDGDGCISYDEFVKLMVMI